MTAKAHARQCSAENAFAPSRTDVLQRKCTCGERTLGGSKPMDHRTKHQGFERRAVDGSEISTVPPDVNEAPRSSGHPLEARPREFMESRFRHDFSNVRVHRDATAYGVAGRFNALAVTHGRDIYFSPGSYAPHTERGRTVLAHELVHVVQGDGIGTRAPKERLEAEALDAGVRIARGGMGAVGLTTDRTFLALTRAETTGAGTGIGAAILGTIGSLAGLAIAAAAGAALGLGALAGGLIGLGVGALVGSLVGYFTRRTERVTPNEADELIQGRYGRHLQQALAAGVSVAAAEIHVVDEAPFCAAYLLKYPNSQSRCRYVDGWVDEDSTPRHIWIKKGKYHPGLLVHEGLHLYANDAFGNAFRNEANEGATEYFTRKILERVNIEPHPGYAEQVAEVEALVDVAGEERLRRAFFDGRIAELSSAIDRLRGRGTMGNWWCHVQLRQWRRARECMKGTCTPCP